MTRCDGRAADRLRPLKFKPDYLAHPLSSVLIEQGGTKVICAVSFENKIPPWMRAQKVSGGWLTCEYGLLPASTGERCKREASSGKQGGRTMEIQRLIGRSLRSTVDLQALGENTATVDCDVIDADGGTRCASITGASLAFSLAMLKNGTPNVVREPVAAISVGIVGGVPMLDLCYEEDSNADVDMNVVMTESGKLVEIQGTAEGSPFSRKQLNELIDLAESGLKEIFAARKKIMDAARSSVAPKRLQGNLSSLGDAFAGVRL